jgi:hypothetical protein
VIDEEPTRRAALRGRRRGHRRRTRGRRGSGVAVLARPHDGRPELGAHPHPAPAAVVGGLPVRADRRRAGGDPSTGPSGRRRLPRRRLRAGAAQRRDAPPDDGVPRRPAPRRAPRGHDVRGHAVRRRRQSSDHLGSRDPGRGHGDVTGRRDRLRRVGHPCRHPARPGRSAVHDHREERGAGRHLVREPLPGRARRRRQPPVLLLVRTRRPLEPLLLRATRAARHAGTCTSTAPTAGARSSRRAS